MNGPVTLVGVGTIVGVWVGEGVPVDVGSGRLVAVGITNVDFIVGVEVASRTVVLSEVGLVSRLVVNTALQLTRKRKKSARTE